MITTEIPPLMTVEYFCRLTNSNCNSVRDRCRAGKIPAEKVAGKWMISRDLAFAGLIEKENQLDK